MRLQHFQRLESSSGNGADGWTRTADSRITAGTAGMKEAVVVISVNESVTGTNGYFLLSINDLISPHDVFFTGDEPHPTGRAPIKPHAAPFG